ncbi:MAG: choice-of-anchor tandem repeat GloVer-containing protein [Candidatus Korobacteraceae bacterium]
MKRKTLGSLLLITLVASLLVPSRAQTFSVIHAFDGKNGANPIAGLTTRDGILYGTTAYRDIRHFGGSVYQITRVESEWITMPIFFFPTDGSGGTTPEARVVFGPDGLLYGTTAEGGIGNGSGVAFHLAPPPPVCSTTNCSWSEDVLHAFQGAPDGYQPGLGDLVWDSMGSIYGTTQWGGSSERGTVYQMTKSGDQWTETPIYSFKGDSNPEELDGSQPYGGVIVDDNGNLFGTTVGGGLYGGGTIFELTYVDDVGWTETILHSFQDLSDGRAPVAALFRDSMGNLYGTATDGGAGGGGTLFELSPIGNGWTFTVLYSFAGQPGMYCGPYATLTVDNSGSFYDTTYCGGANNLGSVFRLTNTQNDWQYTSLHDFTGGSDGEYPISGVTFDKDGNLYGTAEVGGTPTFLCGYGGCGTVWMIKP